MAPPGRPLVRATVARLMATGSVAGLVAGLVASAGPASAAPKPPPPRYLFGGVPWLAPADSARASLVARDYRPVSSASDSQQIVLRGKMFDHDALVTGQLDEKRRLVRWVVMVTPRGDPFPYPGMREVYDEVTRESQDRYGTPRSITERYRFPYQRNDGRQDHALRDGLATIRQTWESKSGDRLTIEMDANCSVVLAYECQEWAGVEKRRQAKRASDL
jgi:hypothetical protein